MTEPHLLRYPWTTPEPLEPSRLSGLEIPNPLFLVPVAVNQSGEDAGIGALGRRLRLAYPSIPLVLWCRDTDASPALLHRLDRIGAAHGIRGTVVGDRLHPDALREQLTDPTGLGHDVLQWLLDTGIVTREEADGVIQRLVQETERDRTLKRIRSHLRRAAACGPLPAASSPHAG